MFQQPPYQMARCQDCEAGYNCSITTSEKCPQGYYCLAGQVSGFRSEVRHGLKFDKCERFLTNSNLNPNFSPCRTSVGVPV